MSNVEGSVNKGSIEYEMLLNEQERCEKGHDHFVQMISNMYEDEMAIYQKDLEFKSKKEDKVRLRIQLVTTIVEEMHRVDTREQKQMYDVILDRLSFVKAKLYSIVEEAGGAVELSSEGRVKKWSIEYEMLLDEEERLEKRNDHFVQMMSNMYEDEMVSHRKYLEVKSKEADAELLRIQLMARIVEVIHRVDAREQKHMNVILDRLSFVKAKLYSIVEEAGGAVESSGEGCVKNLSMEYAMLLDKQELCEKRLDHLVQVMSNMHEQEVVSNQKSREVRAKFVDNERLHVQFKTMIAEEMDRVGEHEQKLKTGILDRLSFVQAKLDSINKE